MCNYNIVNPATGINQRTLVQSQASLSRLIQPWVLIAINGYMNTSLHYYLLKLISHSHTYFTKTVTKTVTKIFSIQQIKLRKLHKINFCANISLLCKKPFQKLGLQFCMVPHLQGQGIQQCAEEGHGILADSQLQPAISCECAYLFMDDSQYKTAQHFCNSALNKVAHIDESSSQMLFFRYQILRIIPISFFSTYPSVCFFLDHS